MNIVTQAGYTSEPFVLIAYIDENDLRPAMHAYKVVATVDVNGNSINDPEDILFDYSAVAGTLLVKPYPLPLMPLPLVGTGASLTSKDVERAGIPDVLTNGTLASDAAYRDFTFKDRKGFVWNHRGPHGFVRASTSNGSTVITVGSTANLAVGMGDSGPGVPPGTRILSITNGTTFTLTEIVAAGTHDFTYTADATFIMKLYYVSRDGFFVPGASVQPPAGTIMPFLRNPTRRGELMNLAAIDVGGIDEPRTITYRPAWPDNTPELRVGETLTLPKFGLPQVRGQKSAEVYYQQSIAQAPTSTAREKASVSLLDPTREKTVALDAPVVGLSAVPPVVKTTSFRGKTYFQLLPPHLQQRVYVDGPKGTLVLLGEFHDEASGEDYLDLNLLTASEETTLKGLVPNGNTDKTKWDTLIDALETKVETFKPNPTQLGSFVPDSTKLERVGENEVAFITNTETAVDSYALSAVGQGVGYVTLVFGNGRAVTPEGDPVQVKIIRVARQLYVGDLKPILSSNPLDEQVTLRHSGDFAGKPEDYEFEWKWAAGAASAPATYSQSMTSRIGTPTTNGWRVVRNPRSLNVTPSEYTKAGSNVFLPRTENVRPVSYLKNYQDQIVNLPATRVTVSSLVGVTEGTSVTGPGISGTAVVAKLLSSKAYILSQNVSPGTRSWTYGGNRILSSVADSLPSNVISLNSYTEADIAAGYPSMSLRCETPVNFSHGVPGSIVFSAELGDLDGFVLYVNGSPAAAYNAPAAIFASTNPVSGLSPVGLSGQFSAPSSFFTAGNNIIEVAVYTAADPNTSSVLDFRLDAAVETDLVVQNGSAWQTPSDPSQRNTNLAIVGGDVQNPFGGPQFVLNDRWFTMRYRPKASNNNVMGTTYSRWMPPQFVEGWIKRVLAAINPFNQRVTDLYNNAVNTDVSLITQAGTRWEGDVALTLDNVNNVGLIALYETVLNRGKNLSINANTNDPDSNNALTLAAGYLNDLYILLGNEAFADAANPTISIDDQDSATEVNTSRFSFEGQVASSLDEELALLRGRDDFTTRIDVAPSYNRLYWNYTRGINSGEALYAVNYNIREKAGSSTANGVIDEFDAQRMFPQGHGDAYGHYLTAITGYYQLLTNSNFTWTPRAEAVTVLGQPVTVDYRDERKLASAAANLARTAFFSVAQFR